MSDSQAEEARAELWISHQEPAEGCILLLISEVLIAAACWTAAEEGDML